MTRLNEFNKDKRYAYGSGPEMELKDSHSSLKGSRQSRKKGNMVWAVIGYLLNPLSLWSSAKRQARQEAIARDMKRNRR